MYRARWLATRDSQIALQRWNILESRLNRGIGRHVLSFWYCTQFCFLWTTSCKSKRGIFRVDPAKQRATFFGVGRDQSDAGWRRQKRDCWRIDNLENVKAEGMRDQRERQKNGDR